MITEPDNDWDKPWVFRQMMNSARDRCFNVAESERLLGYDDTAIMYCEMAREFHQLDLWVLQEVWSFPPAA